MNTTVDQGSEPFGPIRRIVRYGTGLLASRHAANARKWTERYESTEMVETLGHARRWAIESALVQLTFVAVTLLAVKTPIARLEEPYRAWDAALPPITERALAASRHGWYLLPLVCLEAYLLYRLRVSGGVKAWYAEIAAGLMMVFWVWFACWMCFAVLIPFLPM